MDTLTKKKKNGEVERQPTSLVLQISPRADPQALPGVAFHGMIPATTEFFFNFDLF